jgi:hypothetical protein
MTEISSSRASWREGLHDDSDGIFVDEVSNTIVMVKSEEYCGRNSQILWFASQAMINLHPTSNCARTRKDS